MNIQDIVQLDNVADKVKDQELMAIGIRVCQEYEVDRASMKDWLSRNEMAVRLIDQKPETKTEPWFGAANTKLPLVLNAAMRVSAEEYAEIMRGKDLVKYELYGTQDDAKRARGERVAKRMNFQYHHELEDWEEDHDKLILAKNIFGTVHKKYVYCKEKGRVECVLRRNGVVINDNVEHMNDAPRITDEIDKYWWECEEKFRSGDWKRIELKEEELQEYAKSDKPQRFYEQLRREDLDDDGYPEPYVITVHEKTKQVVSIIPNFTPESIKVDQKGKVIRVDMSRTRVRYVKYEMIPSYEGGYWGFGFGILLGPLNDNCNALINQLLDSGTLANNGGGFISQQLRTGHGPLKFKKGEWKPVNAPGIALKDAFFPIPVRDPSPTLFNLLGLLMDVLKELSSVTDVMAGDQPHANMAEGTIMSLIEQGKKVFNSIYKRHYGSLRKEFLALFDLNFLYEDPEAYMKFHDITPEQMVQNDPRLQAASPAEMGMGLVQGDFERAELDVLPTANPEFSSKVQRMVQAQALAQFIGRPELNAGLVLRMYAEGVTDDSEMAKQLVPDDPIKTPEMILQEMEVMKQQILDSAEVKKAELDEKIKQLDLQIKTLELQKAQVELPEKARGAEAKADAADFNAMKSAAELDKIQLEMRKMREESRETNDKG